MNSYFTSLTVHGTENSQSFYDWHFEGPCVANYLSAEAGESITDERGGGEASTNGAAQSEACAVGGMRGDKARRASLRSVRRAFSLVTFFGQAKKVTHKK